MQTTRAMNAKVGPAKRWCADVIVKRRWYGSIRREGGYYVGTNDLGYDVVRCFSRAAAIRSVIQCAGVRL